MVLEFFSKGIEVQLFYALAITLFVYSIPADQQNLIVSFSGSEANVDMGKLAGDFETSFSSVAGFGIVDVAALALFSGNIVIDLMLNFFTAIPSMITILLEAIFFFIYVPAEMQNTLKVFVFIVVAVAYVIALLGFLLQIRTQSAGAGL